VTPSPYSERSDFTEAPAVAAARQTPIQRYEALCFDKPYLRGRETEPKRYALMADVPDACFNRHYAQVVTANNLDELEPWALDLKENEACLQVTDLWTGFVYAPEFEVVFKRQPLVTS
jgi:hypothetical protein